MKTRAFAVAALFSLFTVAAIARADDAAAVIGQPAPAFTLKSIEGKDVSLADSKGKFVVLEWYNPGCPFVRKHYDTGNMQKLQKKYAAKGVQWYLVNSSAAGKEGNMSADEYKKLLKDKEKAAAKTLLIDHDGKVGKLYGAKTTPHMFVISKDGTLIYAGAIDDKPTTDQEDVAGARNFVALALDEAMAGKPVTHVSQKAYGCSVKY